MFVDKKVTDKTAFLKISGKIDTSTVSLFREELAEIDYASIERMEMDFSEVRYVSSAGLRELMALKMRMEDKPFHISNVNDDIDETFNMTGFSNFLDYTVRDSKKDYSHMSFKAFLAQKVKYGEKKTIIEANGDSYTWEDIDKCSQIIADDLSRQGVGKGTHIAICGVNSINWILTFYAVQKLGAIALLVNFNLGASEIITLSKVGDITHFCYGDMPQMKDETAFLSEIKGGDSLITSVYDIRSSISIKDRMAEYDSVAGKFEGKVGTDDACVMIFTSGSTGVPKAVLLSAYNILNAACSNVESLHLTKDDKACLILPLFHIFGMVAGLFANAVSDATMLIPDSIKTSNLIRVISENQCTVFHSVPTMLLSIVNNKDFDAEKMKSLRSTILSGAPISESQMAMLQERFPNNHFAASYGLSEMAPVSITDYEDTPEHITKTIGKPIPGVEIRIFDTEKHQVCETGVSGEIQVQGYNLMTCYYKAQLDKQSIDMEGWLHTGDLGYFDEDGYIHFVGRSKELIIRGGENIIPNEIASAISENEDIADVKVVGVPDDFWGEIVAAAVLMKEGKNFSEETMRNELTAKLAKYKIPAYFVVYDSFPSLPNGKVDAVNLKKDVIAKVTDLKEQA